MKFRNLLSIILLFTLSASAEANVVYSGNVHTQIVSEFSAAQSGQTFQAAIHFKMDPHWHVYWRNPGDSGIAPFIEWDLPEGVTVGEFRWPLPEFIPVDPLMTYGYHGDVLLPFDVNISKSYSGEQIILKGKLEYLACEVICVPGKANLELVIPISSGGSETSWKGMMDQQTYPAPLEVSVMDDLSHYVLSWKTKGERDSWHFFPYRDDIIDHAKSQEHKVENDWHELRVVKSDYHPDQLHRLSGVISGFEFDSPIYSPSFKPSHYKLWMALLFAFLGGIILNLMPCVLPVLSIKILKLVEQAEHNRREMLRDGFMLSLGIISAFWVLALLLIVFKSVGQEIGWGFQFQSPLFVIAMSILFLILALNMFGVFEIGVGLTRFRFIKKSGAFWDGVLATIVATPCTAPFMGAALGFALTQSHFVSFLVFTFLGLGLATPFLLVVLLPPLRTLLPKPGPWMIHMKRFFGILFLLTVVWLLWILSLQVNIPFLSTSKTHSEISWQEYSPELIEKYRQENKVVFLDFTARWCLTCQVNEKVALSDKKIINKFKELSVVAVKADWTNYDENITKALEDLGRYAIPLYVLYPKNKGDPILLPELITPSIVLDYLEKLE